MDATATIASSDRLRDPWPLLRWMRGLLALEVVVYACLFVIGCFAGLVKHNPFMLRPEHLMPATLVISYVQVANVALFVTGLAFAARLTYRMMKNVRLLKGVDGRITPLWSVLWYFVPIANLAMPLKAVMQIWEGTFGDGAQARQGARLIWWWWGAGIASIVCYQLGLRVEYATDIVTPITFADAFNPASYAFGMAGIVLFIRSFSRMARAQSMIVAKTKA